MTDTELSLAVTEYLSHIMACSPHILAPGSFQVHKYNKETMYDYSSD